MFDSYEDIMTIEELAEALRIGTTQAYKLVNSGVLKAYKEGKDWKIPKDAVIMYIRKQSKLL